MAPEIETHDDWTPFQGFCRGLVGGLIATVILACIADVLAWYQPGFVINFWLRMAAGLFTAFLLFNAVHHAAGMTGPACTAIVIVGGVLIVLSQHAVFAIHGIPGETTRGIGWFSPLVLAWLNFPTVLGMSFGVWAWRDGASVHSLVDMLGRGS